MIKKNVKSKTLNNETNDEQWKYSYEGKRKYKIDNR